ncbi:MAG: ribosome small subunit-dependent GTPase A [Defluviitaleaceae bacterium]|nr:ribosome small subunit-dependent GTPase A [Defluviitaleaceae bacterium]
MADMLTGRIVKGVGGNYYVMTEFGEFVCQARGLFRKEGISPIVGDFVEISVIGRAKSTGYLQKILPRENELLRPKVANIDQVLLVCAIVPQINLDVVDGFLMVCEKQGIDVILCINKIDLDADRHYLEVGRAYEMAGYRVLYVSAQHDAGLDGLRAAMEGKVSILAGPSGVGKSSLLNALFPQFGLEVGGLSEKIGRGKHTTRHTALLEVGDGTYVVDSPGFTSFSIAHIDKKHLQYCYREFKPHLEKCYYVDCIHISEHDCAVKERVGIDIDTGRYERYVYYALGERQND